MDGDNIHHKQARTFGQRVLRQIRRIANYGAPRAAVRVTLHDIAKAQADTWDRETGVIGELRDGDWDDQTFQRMHPELAGDLAEVAAQGREAIASGEFSAAAVAQCYPDLYADVTDVFMLLDPTVISKQVLDDVHADNLTVNRALDDLFGDITDPTLADLYGDEDDAS